MLDEMILDDGFLRCMSLDFLGRPPLESERRRFVGKSIATFSAEVLGSRDFWSHWLDEQLYYFLLIDNFRPAGERIQAMPAELEAERLSVSQALRQILLSSSFELRNPGADTFVTVVIEQLLGINVQKNARELEIGKRAYDGHKGTFLGREASSQSDVIRNAVEDERFWPEFLEREFQRIVRRELPRRESQSWARRIRSGEWTYLQVLRDWVMGEAYAERLSQRSPISNRLFVRSVFVDLFDRLPERSEARRMRSALDGMGDSAPLRSVLVRLILDSDQVEFPLKSSLDRPRDWIRAQFLRFLGRPPEASELESFAETLRQPACRPATVVYALMTHHEYQLY